MQLIGCLVMAVLGIFSIVAGTIGIQHEFGHWWSVAALGVAFLLRFTLPLTVGVFFCCRDVWGWHWAFALLAAVPGLIFMVPMVVATLIDGINGLRRR